MVHDFFEMAKREAMSRPEIVETNGLTWLGVLGAICLALRLPAMKPPARDLLVSFAEELGYRLVDWGVLTPDELAEACRVEQEESPHKRPL